MRWNFLASKVASFSRMTVKWNVCIYVICNKAVTELRIFQRYITIRTGVILYCTAL